MGCLGFLSEFIFEAVLEACISISVFSFFDGNKKGKLAYRIFTFREFKSIHKGKTASLHLCFGTEKNRRLDSKKARYIRAFRRRHLFCLHIMARPGGFEPTTIGMQESKSCALPLGDSPVYKVGWVVGFEPTAFRATI